MTIDCIDDLSGHLAVLSRRLFSHRRVPVIWYSFELAYKRNNLRGGKR